MKTIIYLTILIAVVGCEVAKKNRPIAELSEGVIRVNFDRVKDSVVVPLSDWIEDLEIVQLDGSTPDAYVKYNPKDISENYLLMGGFVQPVKMFERHSGKFIGNVGNRGRGRGEYTLICDARIDESEQKIYLLQSMSDEILVYNFDRSLIEKIPLVHTVTDGRFDITNRIITVVQVPLANETQVDRVIWQQDFEGNLIAGIANEKFAAKALGREPEYDGNSENFDFQIMSWNNEPDSLYNYDPKTNTLKAVFVLDFDNFVTGDNVREVDVILRDYIETEKLFMGSAGRCVRLDSRTSEALEPQWLYINKSDLSGFRFTLQNDFIGGIKAYPNFNRGYYIVTYEPLSLIKELETAKGNATAKARERIDKLLKSINEEGNNLIMIGKLKI